MRRDIQVFSNMQISQVMTSYTQPNFDEMMKRELYLSQILRNV